MIKINKKSKIALIGAEDEENLSIRYLAASLKKNKHSVKIIPCSSYEDFPVVLTEFKEFNPDMVGVSIAFQSLALMFFELINKIKKIMPDAHITVGGHFPTFEYEKILNFDFIDSVIRFEGEKSIVILADALKNNEELSKVPNLIYKTNAGEIKENPSIHKFPELDDLPFPLRNKHSQIRLGEKFAALVTGRGCFHAKCIYCCIGAFHSKKEAKQVLRSSSNVAAEIEELYKDKRVRLFQLHDDNFLFPSKKRSLDRIKALQSALDAKNIDTDKIAFLIKTRPESIDEDVAVALKSIGTVGVFLGIENASKSGLKALARGSIIENITESMEILKKHQIAVTFNLLMFHPRANLKEINENIYFMKENKDHAFGFGRAEIVAGSPLDIYVRRKRLLTGEWPSYDYRILDNSVEKMFRINALTFYRKDSPYPTLSQQMIAIYYRAAMLERLYNSKRTSKLSRLTNSLIVNFNQMVLENFLQVYGLTADLKSKNEIDELYLKINEDCTFFTDEIGKLSLKMGKFQAIQQKLTEIKNLTE